MTTGAGLILFSALLSAASASAQELRPLMRTGMFVDGDEVTFIGHPLVDDDGDWSALVGLEYSATRAILRNGEVWVRTGDYLEAAGGNVRQTGVPLGSARHTTAVSTLDGLQGVVVRDGRVVFLEGEPLRVQGLPASEPFQHSIFGPHQAFGADEDTFVGVLRLLSGGQAVVRVEFSPDGLAETRTADLVTGQLLPDGSRAVEIEVTSGKFSVNARSQWIAVVVGDDGAQRLVSPGAIHLRTGGPSPIPGRTIEDILWENASNDLGGFATLVTLSGDPASDTLLVKNSTALAQEGEVLPSLAPYRLTSIAQVSMDNSGAVVWSATTDGPLDGSTAWMRDREPIVRAGATSVAGRVVECAAPHLDVSPGGRFWLGPVELAGLPHTYLVRADLGSAVPLPGCTPGLATLRTDGGLVLAGRTVELVMDGPAPLGALARLHLTLGTGSPLDCGRATPFGELFVDPTALLAVLPGGTFASAPVRIPLAIPADAALVDLALVAQGSFAHPNGVVLTNGLALTIGAP